MRPTAYRAKERNSDEWLFADCNYARRYPNCTNFMDVIKSKTMGQSLHERDINGVRIYEDDIVEASTPSGSVMCVVEWDFEYGPRIGGFRLREIGTAYEVDWRDCLNEKGILQVKIVGNIHDNPEMLEAEEKSECV